MRNFVFLMSCLTFCGSMPLWAGQDQAAPSADDPFDDYTPPPFERFSSMVERPLFLSTRRPVKIVAPVAKRPVKKREVSAQKINVLLSGVIHDGTEFIALIRKGRKGELIQLKKNKTIDGWRLVDVKPEQVTLNKGANFTTVKLRDNKPSTSAKKATAKNSRAAKIRAEKLRKARILRQRKKALSRSSKKKN